LLIALSFVGIDLTVLSVLGGAIGVGIGLGLQKLASNYIAGFTILLDRSIRVGAQITVDNRFGDQQGDLALCQSCGASTASRRSCPTRPGDHDGPEPFVYQQGDQDRPAGADPATTATSILR
jgi:small-conductance mechanosensitive channel